MKNIKQITATVIVEGVEFTLFQFTSETEPEKYFGAKPFGLVEKRLLKEHNGEVFNGFQLNVAETPDRCISLARAQVLARRFRQQNPNASEMELVKYLLSI